ncbi:MAG: hypothetical protein M3O33_04810 [Cyanobacteriota bacterium]|jgi:hypothetical protein|nr:hypothetical protein [Cyanobacteriota bacterium]
MKTFKDWMVVPATLAMLLTSVGVARSQTIQITPGFKSDLVVTGTSGGSQSSKGCGMTGATPNYVIKLGNNFSYLRFSVQGAGQPTLFIQGPNGSSCVQADSFSGGKVEAPGYWESGTYSVYVGNRAQGQHPYTLTVTQKRS